MPTAGATIYGTLAFGAHEKKPKDCRGFITTNYSGFLGFLAYWV
jgi:hypothetical protein